MIEVSLAEPPTGTDLTVANAARRSFGASFDAWSEEPRTRRGRSDRQLIEDLARDGHELPFRHPHVMLTCTAPVPVARQLGKHQVGFSWSEISRRYKTTGLSCHQIEAWRADVIDRRQGSGVRLTARAQEALVALQMANIERCVGEYQAALELGAAPEQARFLLPQSMDVAWTWTGSLLAWSDLCAKRRHADTQEETRAFAEAVSRVIAPLFPVSWVALGRRRTEGVAA
jgi:thymidylate synthase (FAD)